MRTPLPHHHRIFYERALSRYHLPPWEISRSPGQILFIKVFTPCYKKSILGLKQPVSGNLFFCRFSLRLSENNRSRVKFMAKFGPTASNFGYIIFPIFG